MRKAVIITVLLALLLVPAALASETVLSLGGSAKAAGTNVNLTLRFSTGSPHFGPGASVVLTNCKFGQQTPLSVAHQPRLDPGQSLSTKPGHLVWRVASLSPKTAPRVLRLVLVLPQGKGGPYFCVHASARTNQGSTHVAWDLKVPLQ